MRPPPVMQLNHVRSRARHLSPGWEGVAKCINFDAEDAGVNTSLPVTFFRWKCPGPGFKGRQVEEKNNEVVNLLWNNQNDYAIASNQAQINHIFYVMEMFYSNIDFIIGGYHTRVICINRFELV